MRVVADTNVIISGLFWHGAPRKILVAARDEKIELYTSGSLLAELDDVLQREKMAKRLASAKVKASEIVLGYAALASVVKVTSVVKAITEDPDDNRVLECARAAKADVIVSGDSHLLKLKQFRKIKTLTPEELLNQIS
jgi:putative PIN family toxin of toxin-antitoxin system